MAQAESHLKRIDDLDELLRYLEELGYEKYAALWEMERQYLDGVLLLTKREYRSDGTPYGNAIAIDAAYGHIELDRHGRVRVVPRSGFEWREVRYRIAEHCDVRAIWPPRPPASQPAPGAPLPPSHKPTTPSKKQKRKRPTQHDRLVSLMNDLDLKPGMQPHGSKSC